MSGDRVEWRRVSSGVFWIGIGVLLLLNTRGTLPWFFWKDALAYWPIALVALGLRLVFDRSRYPWAVLLSPLLVLGTLAYVATNTARAPVGDRFDVHADRPAATDRWTLTGGVHLAAIQLKAGPVAGDRLLDATVISQGNPWVRTTNVDGETRVRIEGERHGPVIIIPSRDESWDLTVATDLPFALDLNLAFTRGEIDLSSVPVTRIDLQGAFNDLTLRLGVPASDVRIDVQGAFNGLTIVVPPTVPMRTSTDGFVNSVDGRRDAARLSGPGYRLRLEGAFSRTSVRSE